MTAILAYASPGVAFVAGDTKRVMATHPATKVHRWSTTVVFAQAGNGHQLSSLIGQMMVCRSMLGESLDGLKDAFTQLRQNFYDQALVAQAKSRTPQHVDTNGTLLVADADSGDVIALDFATGTCSSPKVPFGTGGVVQLSSAAAVQWSNHGLQLDLWATASINACTGATVAWPIDLLITRPNDPAGALTVQRRHQLGWIGPGDTAFVA
jgi:hypothetical protein